MKVLIVCSGNKNGQPGTVVSNQAKTLYERGIETSFFLIQGKGIFGYLKHVPKLFLYLRKERFDLVHAHYSDSAGIATMALARPLIVSLMGTDILGGGPSTLIIRLFAPMWKAIIVKSREMESYLKRKKNVYLVPNGVDFNQFLPLDPLEAKRVAGWDASKKNILFLADPSRLEKNFSLAERSVKQLGNDDVSLKVVYDIPHNETRVYFYAADLVLMTSAHEGSPNVIKEALACGCPVVSTRVGDVEQITEGVEGCFVVDAKEMEIAEAIRSAISFGRRTQGAKRIRDLRLDSDSIAVEIIDIYNKVI